MNKLNASGGRELAVGAWRGEDAQKKSPIGNRPR